MGIGYGALYITCMQHLMLWFADRKGLAGAVFGLSVGGGGIVVTLVSALLLYYMDAADVRAARARDSLLLVTRSPASTPVAVRAGDRVPRDLAAAVPVHAIPARVPPDSAGIDALAVRVAGKARDLWCWLTVADCDAESTSTSACWPCRSSGSSWP